jgi:D-alanine-D-alanine ligase
MHVGITFDLRDDYLRQGYGEEETAEFDGIDTIVAIEAALSALGHETDRIGNAQALVVRLARGDRWDMVFNIAEGLSGFGRHALVPALLESYGMAYTFSDPLALSVMLHKAVAKRIVRDHGVRTPDFELVETPDDVDRVELAFPLFVKPVAEGTSKGISGASKVATRDELASVCVRLLRQFRQPALVETFCPGREFTVGILGTGTQARVLGVMEIIVRAGARDAIYSYENKKFFDERMSVELARDEAAAAAAQAALAAWSVLGGRDAGRIDLRCDSNGDVNFLEANPLAGLSPEHSDLPLIGRLKGMAYAELIACIMTSATERFEPRARESV